MTATSRLRMVGYCTILTFFAFVQRPGTLVGDTKFDLVVDPARFLGRALHLWDPQAAFGQVQNQAYGYLWPMGPFFVLGHLAAVPGWMVQRLWWSLLLCIAFTGVVAVARALRIGSPGSQVLAGFAYALSPHVVSLLGPTSVEAWPTAVAPWVLLPLVRGAEHGSPRRAAALSALAVAMCGGVNAAATAAVLPLGVVWLLTRERGPRRRALLTWWPVFTVVATLWWSLPLLLLGRYSPPFLDYIENAPITTSTTSLPDVLAGTSDWVAYASPADWVAGHLLGMTPLLLVDAAVVAGLGLWGTVHARNPHSRFLLLSVLTGVALVAFGWAGPVHGWLAADRQSLLDGALAPLRNLHKFDVVLRLPLVLGLAHLVSVYRPSRTAWRERSFGTGVALAAGFAVLGTALPVYTAQVASADTVVEVPPYWRQVAGFLAARDADARRGTALEVPASSFGDYLWGSPHDDVLQGLARSPWAVRNVIPLAQPGNVRMLDSVTQALELGRPDSRLASYLASNGVGYLVVRNDLAPFRTSAPDPVVLHQALDGSPGLHRAATFGPPVGTGPEVRTTGGSRLLSARGRSAAYPAVEVYRVEGSARAVSAWEGATVPVVAGDPGARLSGTEAAAPAVLAGDARAGRVHGETVLTDGLRRRETAFTAVRQNQSATMSLGQQWRLRSVEHDHRLYADESRWQTRVVWTGIAGVSASTSQAYADAPPPVQADRSPDVVFDRNPNTSFSSGSTQGARGQWWQVRLTRPTAVPRIRITMGPRTGATVTRLSIRTSGSVVRVDAPAPGESQTYVLPRGRTTSVRVGAAEVARDHAGAQLTIGEVHLAGLRPRRLLALPPVSGPAPDKVVLERTPTRPACVVVAGTTQCDDAWRTRSEDGVVIVRRLQLARGADGYLPSLSARVRATVAAQLAAARSLPVQVRSSRPVSTSFAAGAYAAVDRDGGTTWVADTGTRRPRLSLAWPTAHRLTRVRLRVRARAAASTPTVVRVSDSVTSHIVRLDRTGTGRFPAMTTRRVTLEVLRSRPAYSREPGGDVVRLPPGVSELRFPGTSGTLPSPLAVTDLGCGSGPTLVVDGRATRTRLLVSVRDLTGDAAVPAQACGGAQAVSLPAGQSEVDVLPSAYAVPERLVLDRSTQVTSAVPVPLSKVQWGQESRSVRVPARPEPTLLTTDENLNAGWRATLDGHVLPVQRVDGWRQGWWVPAGRGGTVRLSYPADGWYHLALGVGLLGVLLVAAVAVAVRRRARDDSAPALLPSTAAGWADAAAFAVVGGLLAGWPGLAATLLALLVREARAASGLRAHAGWAAAVLVAGGGAALGVARSDGFVAHSTTAQVLALAGLLLAVAAAKGPRVRSRRAGRSRT